MRGGGSDRGPDLKRSNGANEENGKEKLFSSFPPLASLLRFEVRCLDLPLPSPARAEGVDDDTARRPTSRGSSADWPGPSPGSSAPDPASSGSSGWPPGWP